VHQLVMGVAARSGGVGGRFWQMVCRVHECPNCVVPSCKNLHPGSLHPGSLHPGSLHPSSLHPSSLHPGSLHPGSLHPGNLCTAPLIGVHDSIQNAALDCDIAGRFLLGSMMDPRFACVHQVAISLWVARCPSGTRLGELDPSRHLSRGCCNTLTR